MKMSMGQSDAPVRAFEALLARYPLVFYFIITTIFNIVMFVIAAIAFTVVMTWVFNNTKGSLFMAVLVHTSFDWVLAILNRLFPVPIVNDYGNNVLVLIGLGVLVLVLIMLTRGRLGYERYREEVPYPAPAPA
ncbi:MAG TPA: hypothetical protein VIJ87_18220 [Pyrinomonadaceae bacterium]